MPFKGMVPAVPRCRGASLGTQLSPGRHHLPATVAAFRSRLGLEGLALPTQNVGQTGIPVHVLNWKA